MSRTPRPAASAGTAAGTGTATPPPRAARPGPRSPPVPRPAPGSRCPAARARAPAGPGEPGELLGSPDDPVRRPAMTRALEAEPHDTATEESAPAVHEEALDSIFTWAYVARLHE